MAKVKKPGAVCPKCGGPGSLQGAGDIGDREYERYTCTSCGETWDDPPLDIPRVTVTVEFPDYKGEGPDPAKTLLQPGQEIYLGNHRGFVVKPTVDVVVGVYQGIADEIRLMADHGEADRVADELRREYGIKTGHEESSENQVMVHRGIAIETPGEKHE
jgi:hypothetical protein